MRVACFIDQVKALCVGRKAEKLDIDSRPRPLAYDQRSNQRTLGSFLLAAAKISSS